VTVIVDVSILVGAGADDVIVLLIAETFGAGSIMTYGEENSASRPVPLKIVNPNTSELLRLYP
jgi:hypothetical protein